MIPDSVRNLPIATARLPIAYERAKDALAKCLSIDECKTWADKAAALASYAKQADDDTLFKSAMRIKGRAVRRVGELIKEIEASRGGRPRSEEKPGSAPAQVFRSDAARDAGLSKRQQKQALRIASIPEPEFEDAIEADKPPTLTELAKRGTKPAPIVIDHLDGRDPVEFRASIHARGVMSRMAEMCESISATTAVRAANDYDIPDMRAWSKTIRAWLDVLDKEMARCKKKN